MNDLFFLISKAGWSLVQPAHFLLFLLICGMLALFLGRLRAARWLLGLPTLALLLISCLPLGEWLLLPLETRYPSNPPLPAQVDGIVLLGGAFMPGESAAWGQVELTDAAERNFAFLELARHYPEARLLFTGGSGRVGEQEHREADVARDFFSRLGLPEERIHFERDSRNTWENAQNGKALMQPEPGQTWLLVTSAFHMPRSAGIFCRVDWRVLPYPVDHRTSPKRPLRIEFNLSGNLSQLNIGLREWAGLLAYRLTGKTDALLPGACP